MAGMGQEACAGEETSRCPGPGRPVFGKTKSNESLHDYNGNYLLNSFFMVIILPMCLSLRLASFLYFNGVPSPCFLKTRSK